MQIRADSLEQLIAELREVRLKMARVWRNSTGWYALVVLEVENEQS